MITQDDIKKIARASRLQVKEDELAAVTQSVAEVIAYVEMLNQSSAKMEGDACSMEIHASNITRLDEVRPFPAQLILEKAPDVMHSLIVVPSILNPNI